MRRLSQAIALLAAGVAAYYAAPVGLRLLRPEATPPPPPIAVASTPHAPTDRAGDVVLLNSLAMLQRRETVEAELVQTGHLLDQSVEIAGVYRQKGRAAGRKFATLLQGRVASKPARLWQVSNGLFLYTDLSWGAEAPSRDERRIVTRVDLRRIRQELAGEGLMGGDVPGDGIARGQAAASSIDPMLSAAFGGLPMLLESLGANFHFGAPRKMALHNQPVFVMIGHWKPASRAALGEGEGGAPTANTIRRLPNHVLLALGASDLFPYLVEYRDAADQLSAPELTDNARLQQSGRPLLRMEFRRPRFDAQLADTHFAYPEAATVDRRDITDQRLATLRQRQRLKIVARTQPNTRW